MEDNVPIVGNDEGITIHSQFEWGGESFQFSKWDVRSYHAKEVGNPFLRRAQTEFKSWTKRPKNAQKLHKAKAHLNSSGSFTDSG